MAGIFSRRRLLQSSAALAGAAALPGRRARAAVGERKFLFFFASGGWDVTAVLDPHYDTDGVDMDQDTWPETIGGHTFTNGDDRLNVDRFYRRWGRRTAVINGMDMHSVGHESATQFAMTGTSASSYPDWPTILAAHARAEYPLPHVVFSGPSYAGTLGASVVRAGGGVLLDLIDGSILGDADRPAPVMAPPGDSMIDAFVYDRVASYAAKRPGGMGAERAEAMLANLERSMELEGRRFEAGLDDLGSSMLDQSIRAVELMRLGLSRCAMIGVSGGWDTHGDNTPQATQFDSFFAALDELMEHMASTPGTATPYLIDEVVVVALSEFGRTPLLNGSNGRDHWPYGSALVMGSGVNGNRQIGLTDDSLIAEPVDFQTGQASSSGDVVGCENLGTALLQLGGLDPADFLPGVAVLEAVVK